MNIIPVDENHHCAVLTREEAHSLILDLVGQLADAPGAGSKDYYMNREEVHENRKKISFLIGK